MNKIMDLRATSIGHYGRHTPCLHLVILLCCSLFLSSAMAAQQDLDTCRTGPISLLVYDEDGTVSIVPYATAGADGDDSHRRGRHLFSSNAAIPRPENDVNRDVARPTILSSISETGASHTLVLSQSQMVPSRSLATVDASTEGGLSTYEVRPCLCSVSDFETEYYDFDYNDGDVTLFCPTYADYCGLMKEVGGKPTTAGGYPVGCYPDDTVSQIVSRHVIPLALIWYVGVVAFCVFTIHGPNAWRYMSSFFTNTYVETEADRILEGSDTLAPPSSNWHCLEWQRYQYEYNAMARTRWIIRREERDQQAARKKESLPFELKVKAFHVDSETDEDSGSEKDDGSHQDISCTICFVPFQDGDAVGNISCGHLFHKNCLKTWCLRKNTCPLCSTQLATIRQSDGDVEQQVSQDPGTDA